MAAFNFTTVDDRNFALNSRAYPSIYMARQFDNDPGFIEIVEKDNQLSHLIERERIGNISIDGKSNWSSAEELQVALNSQLKIGNFKSPGSGGGSGSGSASDVSVNQSGFETILGANVQAALNSIDEILTDSGGGGEGNSVTYDDNGNILAGETLLGQFSDGFETWGNQSTHTSIGSFDRPEVINPPQGVKQTIENPNLLDWVNGNADFKDPSPRGWRIPTNDEILALSTAGQGSWTLLNGVAGRYLGGGTNCFFPASGRFNSNSGLIADQRQYGFYWSSSAHTSIYGWSLHLNNAVVSPDYDISYLDGCPIRCVRDIATTDFEPCPAGEYQVDNIVWAKSNLSDVATFTQNTEDNGAYFQWGQAAAIGINGQPLSIRHKIAYTSDIPSAQSRSVYNVTSMYTTSVPVQRFQAELHDWGDGAPYVVLRGEDSSGLDNTLVITAQRGYGSLKDRTGPNAITQHGTLELDSNGKLAATHYAVDVTMETESSLTTITFAPEVTNFEIMYYVGQGESGDPSYYIDTDGIMHLFGADNTPLDDSFIDEWRDDVGAQCVKINGTWVDTSRIQELVFGSDYDDITEMGSMDDSYIMFIYWDNLSTLILPRNITNIHGGCMSLSSLSRLILPEKLEIIGNYSLCDFQSLKSLTLPSTINTFGYYNFSDLWSLNELQIGSLDITKCTIGGSLLQNAGAQAYGEKIIRADTSNGGETFKTYVSGFDSWRVVVNS